MGLKDTGAGPIERNRKRGQGSSWTAAPVGDNANKYSDLTAVFLVFKLTILMGDHGRDD